MNRKPNNIRRTPRGHHKAPAEENEVVASSESGEDGEGGEKRERSSERGSERSGRENREFREGRRERGERTGRDEKDQERMDKEFLREMEMRIGYFLESAESELELEPMNSYRRRMVHDMSTKFNLKSESRGEDRARYVTLLKTKESTAPTGPAPRLWDFGNQTFPVNPGSRGIHLALKVDGTVEIYQASEKKHIVADRVVTSKTIRIRKGKILQPDDPGY